MVTKELSQSATEINIILSNTSKDIVDKIPKKFKILLKEIEDKEYVFEYDKTKSLNEQKISDMTRGLISLIYKEYICNEKEKQEYLNTLQEKLKNQEKEKREKYNPDNIFKKKNIVNNDKEKEENVNCDNLTIKVKDKNIFRKVISHIKNFLHLC